MNIIEGDFRKPREVKAKKKFLNEKEKRYFCQFKDNRVISDHSYEIDFECEKVICTKCKLEFSPWHVLKDLCREESHWQYQKESYEKLLQKVEEKTRTKCQNCGKFTPVRT